MLYVPQVLVGLAGAGKTSFANMISLGKALDTVPTMGLSVQTFKKGGIAVKCWDLGGQEQYRSEWKNYVIDCDVVVFVVDVTQPYEIYIAKKELHTILEMLSRPVPILVLANKIDLGPQMTEAEIIEGLNLDYVTDHTWLVVPISAKCGTNIDKALNFLLEYAK
jgi:Arf/Sar family protein